MQIPDHITNAPPGWWTILGILHDRLLKLYPEYEVLQVKEKFGTLRVYLGEVRQNGKAVFAAVDVAEDESYSHCEECGGPAMGPEARTGSWYRTLCDTCWETDGER